MADIKRKIARAVAVLSVAFAAGHVVQNMSKPDAPARTARTEVLPEPKSIETVAATGTTPAPAPLSKPVLLETVAITAPKTLPAAKPAAPPLILAATGATEPAAPALPKAVPKLLTEPLVKAPVAPPAKPPVSLADACAITFDLMAEPNAMIGVIVQAPCRPNERVVVKHAGLAVSGLTTANGALFTGVPAFETAATVEVVFQDGGSVSGKIEIPEIAQLRRFAVQWQANDAFQVHAFENGSGYDGPGHISGADPHGPAAGMTAKGGFLTLLGDSTAANPLLAEVYTFPADPRANPEVVVESAVTATTCGRELLGETLNSIGGKAYVTDLSLVMPDCGAVGDYMVLKNLVLDLNIAAAE